MTELQHSACCQQPRDVIHAKGKEKVELQREKHIGAKRKTHFGELPCLEVLKSPGIKTWQVSVVRSQLPLEGSCLHAGYRGWAGAITQLWSDQIPDHVMEKSACYLSTNLFCSPSHLGAKHPLTGNGLQQKKKP